MRLNTKIKHLGVVMLSMVLAATSVVPGGADMVAAKAPAMVKKNVTVNVNATATVKLKNVNKKAKVSWSSKSKKIVKITKQTKNSAKIKGIKVGTTTVKAKYILGKFKKTITCKVKVVKKARVKETQAPATEVPATATPIVTATPVATATAEITATATPVKEATAEPTSEEVWVTTWGTAEERCDIEEGKYLPGAVTGGDGKVVTPGNELDNSTIRQIIRVTTSGKKLKMRLTNQYGEDDVTIKSLHIAKQVEADKSTIDPDTDTVVTVDGQEEFVIPNGEVLITDEIDFDVKALENIAVSMYLGDVPEIVSGHRGARATTYQIVGENCVSETTLSEPVTSTSWYYLADVSLLQPEGSKAVVCFGDSITDGYGTDASYLGHKPDSYIRWGDYFANRLQANEKTKNVSVINEGIGSNGMLGSYPTDAGKDRFKRDLLEHDGVAYCIILFGVNDLDKLPDTSKFDLLKPEYEKMIRLCHENNIKVYAAPILPFGTSKYYNENSESVRNMINNWFRSEESGVDGIIDFESAVADPDNKINIREDYTHSDGLHPYDGYEAMANAIDLTMFE